MLFESSVCDERGIIDQLYRYPSEMEKNVLSGQLFQAINLDKPCNLLEVLGVKDESARDYSCTSEQK